MKKKTTIILIVFLIITVACSSFSVGFFINSASSDSKMTEFNENFTNLQIPSSLLDENDSPVYVIGHKKPDLDTVFSAIGLANLLKQNGINAVAAISDSLCLEAERVLDRYEIEHPVQLTDASGKKLILVDHSEYNQGVNGIKNAKIMGIIDHHHMGDIKLNNPIFILTEPTGSAATIITSLYILTNTEMDSQTAKVLLAGVLDDTYNLRTPNTTALDILAVEVLKSISGISDSNELYKFISKAETYYDDMTDEEILRRYEKPYNMGNHTQTITYVKVTGKKDMENMTERMKIAMKKIYPSHTADHMYVIMIDLENGTSELLYYGDGIEPYVKEAFTLDEKGRILFDTIAVRKIMITPSLRKAYKKIDSSTLTREGVSPSQIVPKNYAYPSG